jgi:hypothetical protein
MRSQTDKILKKIERVRADNNKLWMAILTLALRDSPYRSKKLLAGINANDRKISELLGKLADE